MSTVGVSQKALNDTNKKTKKNTLHVAKLNVQSLCMHLAFGNCKTLRNTLVNIPTAFLDLNYLFN